MLVGARYSLRDKGPTVKGDNRASKAAPVQSGPSPFQAKQKQKVQPVVN